MQKIILSLFLAILLSGCISAQHITLENVEYNYLQGYYKKSFKLAFPLAKEGIPEAEYTVGYLYYYGYGTEQNTDLAYYWIRASAQKRYLPAIKALSILSAQSSFLKRGHKRLSFEEEDDAELI